MAEHPGFFMFYLPFLGDNGLVIPSKFIQSIQGTWPPKSLALRDRHNNLWQMKAELIDGDWYFTNGWEKFVDNNMIEGGDLLVFEYFSEGILDFKVHDDSGCLREGAEEKKTEHTEEHTEPHDGEEENCSREGEQVMDDERDENNVFPETEEENSGDGSPQEDEVTNGQETVVLEGSANDNPEETAGTASSSECKPRSGYDWYGEEIFRTGLIPQPTTPYFVTKINKRPNELYIPKDVINAYNLKLPVKLFFRDPAGRQFNAKRKVWRDNRMFYTGGWKTLCKTNMVGVEDYCICEFEGANNVFCINVSFFRSREQ